MRLLAFKVVALKKNRYVLYRSHRPPWCPSFVTAVRILIIIRVSGAMYTNISDCDEGALSISSSAKGVQLKKFVFLHQCTISGNRCITWIADMVSKPGRHPLYMLFVAGHTSFCTTFRPRFLCLPTVPRRCVPSCYVWHTCLSHTSAPPSSLSA